jgi:hypothetical protein
MSSKRTGVLSERLFFESLAQVIEVGKLKTVILKCILKTCVLNKCERRKIKTAEMRFLMRVYVYARTDHVRNTTVRNALQIYAWSKKPRPQKQHNRILRMDSSRLTQKIMITNLTDEEMLTTD